MTDVVQVLGPYVAMLEREAAKGAAWRAARALGLPTPAIKWYGLPWEAKNAATVPMNGAPAAAAKSLGFVRAREPHVIWLRVGQDVTELVDTVAHEVHHLAQLRQGGLKSMRAAAADDNAELFAARFTRGLRAGRVRPY